MGDARLRGVVGRGGVLVRTVELGFIIDPGRPDPDADIGSGVPFAAAPFDDPTRPDPGRPDADGGSVDPFTVAPVRPKRSDDHHRRADDDFLVLHSAAV